MVALKDSFRFNIGNFECSVISDGMLTIPHTPPKPVPGRYHEIHAGQLLDVLCLLIRTGEHAILLDTGLGTGGQPLGGKLLHNLKAEGVLPKDIDTVILSHGHGDHISGLTDAQCRPVFPNARYVMLKTEWEFWMSDLELTRLNLDERARKMFLAAVQKNLIPIKDQLDLIDGETEIMAGIKFIMTPGHTPGHIMLSISSGTEQLLCTGDLIHLPSHLVRPDLYDVFDIAPEQGYHTKIQMLSRVVTPDVLIFASHFPFPGLGHIVKKGDGWLWQPIEIKGKT
jgi:glyoxylase-like metal-dependent hydrolase (beta-lactamase superfamily II)